MICFVCCVLSGTLHYGHVCCGVCVVGMCVLCGGCVWFVVLCCGVCDV